MKFTNNKMFKHGITQPIVCPRCGKEVDMQILRSTSSLGILGIPLYNYKIEYFTLCPNCLSIFIVSSDAVNLAEKKKNDFSDICESTLTFVKDFDIK